jgi:hypothetical protein
MNATEQALAVMVKGTPKFLNKGGLCVGLHISKLGIERGMPLLASSLRTAEGGQVEGLGKARIQTILKNYNIPRVLAEEGGRTSRGSLGLMEAYVDVLNSLFASGKLDLKTALNWWVGKVRLHFSSEGPKFDFDSGKSIRANLQDLFQQAEELQRNSGGANYLGAMLQHLVGAKLDLILGEGAIEHHGASVADHSTSRKSDFDVDGVAIHVTTNPGEALIRKAGGNVREGLKPLIITTSDGVSGALFLLRSTEWVDRIDVLDIGQFLTANIYERSLFRVGECKITLRSIIERYNLIVERCETDPVLRIRV